MNILHLSTAKTWRGGEQQLAYLIQGLQSAGHHSILICPHDAQIAQRIHEPTKVILFKKYSSFDFISAYKLARACEKLKIDIIHGHDAHAHTTIWLSSIFFGSKIPVVMSRKVDFAIRASSKRKYNHHDIKAYICVSQAVKKVLSSAIEDTSKLHVIHDGVDIDKFKDDKHKLLRFKYQIDQNQILVANIAAIADHKDYYTFVDTAELLLKKYPGKIKFLCIGGDGGERHAIESYIQKKKLSSYISITGFIPNVYRYIHELDILLFTSKMEALGSSLLDAMAAGVAIVSTDAGGITEIVKHRKNGLVSAIQDCNSLANNVISIIENPSLKRQLTTEAMRHVANFDIDNYTKKTVEIYQKVLLSSSEGS